MTKSPKQPQAKEIEYEYTPSINTHCKICGICSFAHRHYKGDFPKDFEVIEEPQSKGKRNPPLDNLTRIREAYEMRYSAELRVFFDTVIEKFVVSNVVNIILDNETQKPAIIILQDGKSLYLNRAGEFAVNVQILSYKYMGELGGSGEIAEGSRFRVKETGEIGAKTKWIVGDSYIMLDNGLGALSKLELEPYFD